MLTTGSTGPGKSTLCLYIDMLANTTGSPVLICLITTGSPGPGKSTLCLCIDMLVYDKQFWSWKVNFFLFVYVALICLLTTGSPGPGKLLCMFTPMVYLLKIK